MSNKYPLDIENVGNDTYIVMSKGHHDIHDFMKAVREAGYNWPLGNPQHVWIKATPDRTGESRALCNIVTKEVRGAFPATYSWEAYGDEQYDPNRRVIYLIDEPEWKSKAAKLAHEKLLEQGYSLVSSEAILNDVVTIEFSMPAPQVRAMTLSTAASVLCFNLEAANGWRIYRKESEQ
jgi:hypothetical protein